MPTSTTRRSIGPRASSRGPERSTSCTGEIGVHDLVGNVHEWVSDTVDGSLVARLEAEGTRSYQPWQPGNGVFMGGFYSTREEHGRGCGFTTVAHEPGYHDDSTGFRCCADAVDPMSALVASASAG